jgi:hypothetical protein
VIKVSGVFKFISLKDYNGKKNITVTNSNKDKEGNYVPVYYNIWVSDKNKNLFSADIKKQMAEGSEHLFLDIEGSLVIKKDGQYTNCLLYPTEVKRHVKAK